MSEVTQILNRCEQGDETAAEQLLVLLYDELRKLAAQKLAKEPADRSPRAGMLIGDQYVLQQPIGEGGMGDVWVAKQTSQ